MSEDLIDHPLIGDSGILQPEGHYLITVSPSVNDEGYLLFIFGIHPDLIVSGEGIHERHKLES